MTFDEAALRLRNHQVHHMDVEGWGDIGYHYVIAPGGQIFAGRSLFYIGSHVYGNNTNNVGVCLMGSFDQHSPTPLALDALTRLLAFLCETYKISTSNVFGHRDFDATECPGDKLYAKLPYTLKNVQKLLEESGDAAPEVLRVHTNADGAVSLLRNGKKVKSLQLKLYAHSGKVGVVLDGTRVQVDGLGLDLKFYDR
jgi:N-acetyl-anhydromuramyl-L-alanine amidase AmpD